MLDLNFVLNTVLTLGIHIHVFTSTNLVSDFKTGLQKDCWKLGVTLSCQPQTEVFVRLQRIKFLQKKSIED